MIPNDFWYFILWVVTLLSIIHFLNHKYGRLDIFRPINFVLIFLLFSTSASYLGYFIFLGKEMISYRIDFVLAFKLYMVALFVMIAGFVFCKRVLTPIFSLRHCPIIHDKKGFSFNVKLLDIISDTFLIGGTIALALWFYRTGIIPMLYSGNTDWIRFEFVKTPHFSIYSRFIYCASVALGLKLTSMKLLHERKILIVKFFDWIIVIWAFIILFLYGSKMLYFFPIAIYLMNYSIFIKRIDFGKFLRLKFILIIIICIIGVIIITNIRSLNRPISVDVTADFFAVFFPEFRDMARIVDMADKQGLRESTLRSLWFAALPHELFEVVGIEKSNMINSGISYKELLGYSWAGGGARIGIIGELFMNTRYGGIMLGMLIYGMIISFLESLLYYSKRFSFLIIMVNVILFRLTWLLVSELPNNLPLTYLYLYFLIAVYFVVTPMKSL